MIDAYQIGITVFQKELRKWEQLKLSITNPTIMMVFAFAYVSQSTLEEIMLFSLHVMWIA